MKARNHARKPTEEGPQPRDPKDPALQARAARPGEGPAANRTKRRKSQTRRYEHHRGDPGEGPPSVRARPKTKQGDKRNRPNAENMSNTKTPKKQHNLFRATRVMAVRALACRKGCRNAHGRYMVRLFGINLHDGHDGNIHACCSPSDLYGMRNFVAIATAATRDLPPRCEKHVRKPTQSRRKVLCLAAQACRP